MQRREPGREGMQTDALGLLTPIGGSSVKKEFIRIPIPKDLAGLAAGANMLTRGNLPKIVANLLAVVKIIGLGDPGTDVFVAMIVAASMGENGQAMANLLMSDTSMLVPAAMSTTRRLPMEPHEKKAKDNKSNGKSGDTE